MDAAKIACLLLDQEDQKRFAAVIVLRNPDDPEALVVRREFPPEEGKWASPGGHAEVDEDIEDAAHRELKEETGLEGELHYLTAQEIPEQKGAEVTFYYCVVDEDDKARAGDDAEKLKWVKVKDLPELAFTDNERIPQAAKKAFKSAPVAESKATGKRGKTGLLVVIEGVDGAGKTTQINRLHDWLNDQDFSVRTTKWNSSKILSDALFKAKKKKQLSPILFSLLHAADLTWRYENVVVPALDRGEVVLCDRYYYTSYVRDRIRGVNEKLLDVIYADFRKPDIIFYCKVPIRIAVERLLREKGVYYYSAGRDAGYKGTKEECAMQYETDMERIYDRLFSREQGVVEIDTERPIKQITKEIKEILTERFFR